MSTLDTLENTKDKDRQLSTQDVTVNSKDIIYDSEEQKICQGILNIQIECKGIHQEIQSTSR